jgi:hypothetical protein
MVSPYSVLRDIGLSSETFRMFIDTCVIFRETLTMPSEAFTTFLEPLTISNVYMTLTLHGHIYYDCVTT